MVKGWLKISKPEHLQTALVRMMNHILASKDPITHAGRFASLANAWTNVEKWKVEVSDFREVQRRLDELEEQTKDDRYGRY